MAYAYALALWLVNAYAWDRTTGDRRYAVGCAAGPHRKGATWEEAFKGVAGSEGMS